MMERLASQTQEVSAFLLINYFQKFPVWVAVSRLEKGCRQKPTHVNSAVFDGRTILSKTKDEQPHVVLLPTPEAESKAPGAPLQLHWVTTKALEREV